MLNVPTDARLHERLALPDPVRLDGVRVQDVLLEDRLTIALNPFRPVTDIAEVPAEPEFTVTDVGLAVIEKSWDAKVTVTV